MRLYPLKCTLLMVVGWSVECSVEDSARDSPLIRHVQDTIVLLGIDTMAFVLAASVYGHRHTIC